MRAVVDAPAIHRSSEVPDCHTGMRRGGSNRFATGAATRRGSPSTPSSHPLRRHQRLGGKGPGRHRRPTPPQTPASLDLLVEPRPARVRLALTWQHAGGMRGQTCEGRCRPSNRRRGAPVSSWDQWVVLPIGRGHRICRDYRIDPAVCGLSSSRSGTPPVISGNPSASYDHLQGRPAMMPASDIRTLTSHNSDAREAVTSAFEALEKWREEIFTVGNSEPVILPRTSEACTELSSAV